MLMSMAALCAGCADGTAIPTGNRHAPSLASAVRFYSDPPHAPYEVVGLVKAESSAGLTAQESMEYAIEELKKQAASLGANGVLLTGNGARTTGTDVTYNKDSGQISSNSTTAQFVEGRAILVK
ncbi:hypothetical protein AL504_27615 [Achromobacter xylosoxidans]|uniref:Uncharacterized protein n=3 Tax=Alcaligenaceae TaxID=506 RepID=A0A120LI67_ALCXX|nr:hypothetical protein AL504_27615 [Achromobacter xylosoxidans]EGP48232.1 hypothetical protein AXXA_01763 [Achromobacter insuavis AXX-A]